ncbi:MULTISPECIES: hypothetical protein [unclassified Streptomyces]|uniref:hypothetical protein n=1 Tax=unclassified Streptomyces TaxID=2593676 RepID=UPI002365C7EA|nr:MULTISPECIES: hypothetical protein [unclassified Streptomyces]MDF3147079.1 hypothetical protein [Streptomyces sp. T21Q-yed]WDF43532.1 hypothetical protein PBV52_45530 [Streptomyces sp. T12]
MPLTDHTHLIQELHALLASCQDLAARHQATLEPYRDEDGSVRDDAYVDYDEARTTTAIEASDHLDTVVAQLIRLVGPPALQTFTLTFAGRERHDGERPTSFAVHATGLDEARRVIETLPGFRQWREANASDSPAITGPDLLFLPEQSHPGLRAPGEYADLRPEQPPAVPAATNRPTGTGIRPTTPASSSRPRTR